MNGVESAWDSFRRELEKSNDEAIQTAKIKTVRQLSESLRHLRQYETEGEWISALLNSAAGFVENLAIFTIADTRFLLQAQRDLQLPDGLSFPHSSAPALASALESKDVIVAVSAVNEVGPQLGESGKGRRAVIIPVLNGARVVAVVVSLGALDAQREALELVVGMAALVLERSANRETSIHIAQSMGPPANPVKAGAASKSLPAWSNLPEATRNLHIRAQRFARVKVAEMQLAHPDSAKAGREQNDVYLFLKNDIEAARDSYRSQFMSSRNMIDYLHLELVQTAAENDETKLGAEYPGPLL